MGDLGGMGKKKSEKNEEKWGKNAKNREKLRKIGTFLGKKEKKWDEFVARMSYVGCSMSRKKTPKQPGYRDRLLVVRICANGAKNAGF